MTHQELAFEFCGFVHNFMNEIDDIEFIKKTDEMFYRVCFQKLYYALYHKMLHHDVNLSESEAPGKHETIYKKLLVNDPSLAQLYSKMRSLRLWADYKLDHSPPLNLTVNHCQYQVYQALKRVTISL